MSREARKDSSGELQHIVVQGRRSTHVFAPNIFKELYLKDLKKACFSSNISLLAFCILDDHAHIVIFDPDHQMSQMVRKCHSEFARQCYRSFKGQSGGKMFHDRYRSEVLKTEKELLETVRAIHQEPVRLEIAARMEDYPWSSYSYFLRRQQNMIDTTMIMDSLHFAGGFREYMNDRMKTKPYGILREIPEKYGRSDEDAVRIFEKHLQPGETIDDFKLWDLEDQKDLIRIIRRRNEISIMQLVRITGLGRGIIQRL